MDQLGKQLSVVSIGIIVVIAIVGLLHHETLHSVFNIGVSLGTLIGYLEAYPLVR
jgi:hypothetical protein